MEMRGRSEGEMVDAKGGLLGKLFPRGLTLSRNPFGISAFIFRITGMDGVR